MKMGIMNYIKEQKDKFKQRQDARQQANAVEKAKQLKDLKEERVKLEGRVKVHKAYESESKKIAAAKAKLKAVEPKSGFVKVLDKIAERKKERAKSGRTYGVFMPDTDNRQDGEIFKDPFKRG